MFKCKRKKPFGNIASSELLALQCDILREFTITQKQFVSKVGEAKPSGRAFHFHTKIQTGPEEGATSSISPNIPRLKTRSRCHTYLYGASSGERGLCFLGRMPENPTKTT